MVAQTRYDAPAFASTLNCVLDVFSATDSDTPRDDVHKLMTAPRLNIYRAFGWLYSNHTKTTIADLPRLIDQVIEHKGKPKKDVKDKEQDDCVTITGNDSAYYKDLLNILLLAYSNPLTSPSVPFAALESPRTSNTKQNGIEAAKRRKSHASKSAKEARAKECQDPLGHLQTESKEEKQRLKWTLAMAANWARTLQSAHDRQTNIATAACRARQRSVGWAKQLRVDPEVKERDLKDLCRH
ncbi:hypothetical protein FRB90_004281 [Tulasnella sp. 427]|nr:hypothetical protein FRB90_004281 [Tulasnella sp. 427]